MKQISNADFELALRLLNALARNKGTTIKECENSRKAFLLYKKLKKNEEHRLHKAVQSSC